MADKTPKLRSKTDKRTIEYVSTSSLTPYARNSRTHSPQQVKQIAASIKEFGFTNPILIDEANGIIAGHGRVMAAEHLQLGEVPCIRLEYLTQTQKRAYVIADNKLALNAGWDEELLKLELDELHGMEYDVSLLGFDEAEVGAFDVESIEMPELASGDKEPFRQVTFTLHDEQWEELETALKAAKALGHNESAVNENSNGNAIAFICYQFNRKQ